MWTGRALYIPLRGRFSARSSNSPGTSSFLLRSLERNFHNRPISAININYSLATAAAAAAAAGRSRFRLPTTSGRPFFLDSDFPRPGKSESGVFFFVRDLLDGFFSICNKKKKKKKRGSTSWKLKPRSPSCCCCYYYIICRKSTPADSQRSSQNHYGTVN